MADGQLYWDTREPLMGSSLTSVTLSTTDKAIYSASNFPVLGGQYFARVGRLFCIEWFGALTTAATPGNLTWDIYYGTGADANGTILASSAAHAATANQTSASVRGRVFIRCVTIGSAGTLFVWGDVMYNEGVVAAKQLIPTSAPAVSSGVDLTAANIISVQLKRSGSTAETFTTWAVVPIACS
jgi:hypothetical protein